MKVLFIGDVVGSPGRLAVRKWLPYLLEKHAVDIAIANGENVAGGLGATASTLKELLDAGVQVVTLGNHVWRRKELVADIDRFDNVVRPANYPAVVPGKGSIIYPLADGRRLGVINLLGRVFMEALDCPFAVAERELALLQTECRVVIVDFHAEATSEKIALARFLDGRCSAVIGTHTHVQTADEQVLPDGTGFITDVGMTGPMDSVIGVTSEAVIRRFRTGMPTEFKVADGRLGLHAVLLSIDDQSGKTHTIERIRCLQEE